MGRSIPLRRLWLAVLLVVAITAASVTPALAIPPDNEHFDRTWARTDLPVANGNVSRTWMWGPEAFTTAGYEPYAGVPGDERLVQYFDKSRMEINNPGGDPGSPWYVTNGLLVVEMTSGRVHVGFDEPNRLQYLPAEVNVAGDADDPTGPTYTTIGELIDNPPVSYNLGGVIFDVIDRLGWNPLATAAMADQLAAYGVTAAEYSPATGKHTASVFWQFMNSTALVYQNGSYVNAPLFQDPYYATGLPIDEAWWANVKVGGTYKWVLLQCFERRCLTYTPDNPPGWQVEAGNVGLHYFDWRYGEDVQPTPPSNGIPALGDLVHWDPLTDFYYYEDDTIAMYSTDMGYHIIVGAPPEDWIYRAQDYVGEDTLPDADRLANFSASVEVTNIPPGALTAACLFVRSSIFGDNRYVYEFCIDDLGDVSAFYEEIDLGNVEALVAPHEMDNPPDPTEEWVTLQVIARDGQFWYLVNGHLVGTGDFYPGHDFGFIGFSVANENISGDAEWVFRNLEIHALR